MKTTSRTVTLVALAASLASFAPPISQAAWDLNGTPLVTTPFSEGTGVAASDGAGGIIAVVNLYVGSNLYLQRMDSTGTRLWGPSGTLIAPDVVNPSTARIVSDGAGGAIVVYQRGQNLFAYRVDASGAPIWNGGARSVVLFPEFQINPVIAADGTGGVVVAWSDSRVGAPGIYMQRIDASGNMAWNPDGVLVGPSGTQIGPYALIADGQGGVVVLFNEESSSKARRVSAATGSTLWTVVLTSVSYSTPLGVADGSGGAIVLWHPVNGPFADPPRAQRLNGAGAGQWTSSGVVVDANASGATAISSDNGGGAVIVWTGGNTVTARRVTSTGTLPWSSIPRLRTDDLALKAPMIAPDGLGGFLVGYHTNGSNNTYTSKGFRFHRLAGAGDESWSGVVIPGDQSLDRPTAMVPTGDGGAIFVWNRFDAPAMRILARGTTPPYVVTLGTVRDVPNDQGGFVRIQASRAPADFQQAVLPVTGYNLWRRIPDEGSGAVGIEHAASRALATIAGTRAPGIRLTVPAGLETAFPSGNWESVAYTTAVRTPTYHFLASTLDDSTASGPADAEFVITAHTTDPDFFTASLPVSGHSVDNLAPSAPQGLAGGFESESRVRITWNRNPESDLLHYAVHRGVSPTFEPSSTNRLGFATTSSWTDEAFTSNSHYKVSAIDRHGNASSFALLRPEELASGRDPVAPLESALAPPSPNPARAGAWITYSLARAGRARIDLFDPRGRRVATLVDADRPAGDHRSWWENRTSSGGRHAPGVYLVRLQTAQVAVTRRLVVVDR